jgi:hypothetical protein
MSDVRQGGCLCGAVRFEGRLDETGVTACHCHQCRRWGSGAYHSVRFAGGVVVTAGETLSWHAASEWGERGFCSRCGSSLFWRMAGEPTNWAVNAGAMDDETGLTLETHIFADRAAPYTIFDAAPQSSEAQELDRLYAQYPEYRGCANG